MSSSLKDNILTYGKNQICPVSVYGIPVTSRSMWTGPTGTTYAQQWSRGDQTTMSYRINHPLVSDTAGIRLFYVNKGIQPSTGAGSECSYDQTANAANMAGGFTVQTIANFVVDASVNTRISSASYSFTGNDVGRNIRITSGAGWATGSYQVTSVTGSAANLVVPGTATPSSPAAVGVTGGNGVMSGPGTIAIRATLMYGGSLFPFTFNGGRSVSLDYGGSAWTDWNTVDLKIATANSITLVNSVVAAADIAHPTGMQSTSGFNPTEGISVGNDDTAATQAWRGAYAASQFMFHPWLVNGMPNTRNWPVLVSWGDSILVGSQDQYVNGTQTTTRTNDRSFLDVANTGVQSITVTGGGSGYTAATVATVTGANGAGCILGTPVIAAGVITSIPVVSMGFGYDAVITAATVNITDSGGGTGATATVTLGPNYALVKMARQGDGWASGTFAPSSPYAQAAKTTGRLNILSMLGPSVTVICNYASNDIFGSSVSAANVEVSELLFINFCHRVGARVIVTTCPPRPSATSDTWATASGQTLNSTPDAQRALYNTWVRTQAVALGADGIWDICAHIDSNNVGNGTLTTNGGFWLATGVARIPTPDGIHPSHNYNNVMAQDCIMSMVALS